MGRVGDLERGFGRREREKCEKRKVSLDFMGLDKCVIFSHHLSSCLTRSCMPSSVTSPDEARGPWPGH
jgi:hypothetical protein